MGFVSLLLLAIAAVSLVNMAHIESGALRRHRREQGQLCNMINFYTHRKCKSYIGYGCFCIARSRGSNPVDESDRCCQIHDQCYSNADCSTVNPLSVSYSYHCSGPSCQCLGDEFSCEYQTCKCDVELAECLGDVVDYGIRFLHNPERRCR